MTAVVVAVLMAAEGDITPMTLLTGIVLLVGAVGGSFGLIGRRKSDLAKLYQDMYEAQKQQHEDYVAATDERIRRLEARVELFEGDFIRKVAEGVADAVVRMVEEKMPHD